MTREEAGDYHDRVTILLLWILSLSAPAYAAAYTLADLQQLEAERSYEEFFRHAHDVAPSGRTSEWSTMVETMGEAWLRHLKAKNRLTREEYRQIETLLGWPVLGRHEFFRQLRGELGLRWFEQCFAADATPSSACWTELSDFWDAGRRDIDLAARLHVTVAPYLAQTEAPLGPLFVLDPLLRSSLAGLQCKKPDIAPVVWMQLAGLPKAGLKAALPKIAHPDCWVALAPLAREKLRAGAPYAELETAAGLLGAIGQISELESGAYAVAYLLELPRQGDEFNLAWNKLGQLRKAANERGHVLEVLRGWHQLPGPLWSQQGTPRRALARHFTTSFPEYLDLYARTCVDFFGAKRRFPQGNPARHCRDFFALSEEIPDMLPAATREAFRRALASP